MVNISRWYHVDQLPNTGNHDVHAVVGTEFDTVNGNSSGKRQLAKHTGDYWLQVQPIKL